MLKVICKPRKVLWNWAIKPEWRDGELNEGNEGNARSQGGNVGSGGGDKGGNAGGKN